MPRVRVPRHVARLVVDYFAHAARPNASARHTARRAARHRLLHRHHTSECLGTSHGSLSTTLPRVACRRLLRLRHASECLGTLRGSSSTTSLTLCVRLPRLVVDYFAHAARPGASARRAARCHLLRPRHASGSLSTSHGSSRGSSSTTTPRAYCHRLLHLCRASGCLGMSRGLSCGLSSTTSPMLRVRVSRHIGRLVVDYFADAARPGASARHAARRATPRRLLHLCHASGCLGTSRGPCVARRRLLRPRRASECLGMSHGSSRGSSLTTLPTPRIRVPQHVVRLLVDYFATRSLSSTTSPTPLV
jgi:hypothetical protein